MDRGCGTWVWRLFDDRERLTSAFRLHLVAWKLTGILIGED